MKQDAVRKRAKRKDRVRRTLRAQPGRPRLSIFKSNRHIAAQIIDDIKGQTVVGASTYEKELKGSEQGRISRSAAAQVGRRLAEGAKAKGVGKVVLDRGPYKYHGVIAALADAAREAGLKF